MEFTKPQIISEHFKRRNSDPEYIPRVRQQYEINLKPRHMRDELSLRFLLAKPRIVLNEEIWNVKSREKKWSHKPYRNYYLAERQ